MPRLRHSANPRPRCRLISTPTPYPEEDRMGKAVTTLHGVKVPDPAMVELLLLAESQGFRLEPSEGRGGHAAGTGFIVYPPDPKVPPVAVGCVEINKRHVSNVRSSLRAVGLVTNGSTSTPDTAPEQEKETPVATPRRKTPNPVQLPSVAEMVTNSGLRVGNASDYFTGMNDEQKSEALMGIAEQLCVHAGMAQDSASLMGLLAVALHHWDSKRDSLVVSKADLDQAQRDAEEALRIAQQAERERDAAVKRAEKAEREGSETGRLLTQALEDKRVVENELRELRGAIEPFRALLAKTG